MVSPLATAILALSPTVYLQLDDPNGPAASDSSGNGHPGVYNGITQFGIDGVPGGQDTAVSGFPQSVSSPHRINLANNFIDASSFSWMIWLRYFSFTVSETPLSATPNNTTGWYFQWNSTAGQFLFAVRRSPASDSTVQVAQGFQQTLNQWVQYAGTYDNSSHTQTVYANGAIAGQATGITRGSVATTDGLIGAIGPNSSPTQPYTGQMAQFALWQGVVLTLTQIQSAFIAAATVPTTGAPFGGQDVSSQLAAILKAVQRTFPTT